MYLEFKILLYVCKTNMTNMKNYNDLNENEILVLQAISIASDRNGGDFTYFDEVMLKVNSLNDRQVKGYVSQLSQKQYIAVSKDKNAQIFSGKYVDFLTEYQF